MTHLLCLTLALAMSPQTPAPSAAKPAAHQTPAKKPAAKQSAAARQAAAKHAAAERKAKADQEAKARMQQLIALQVTLDRAGFSTGVVDGREGSNTTRAVEAYRAQNGSDPQPSTEPLIAYQITEQDAAGPYETIPSDMMEQSKLEALTYQSIAEMLAERFHTTPQFLQTVNPSVTLAAGQSIMVPNVEPFTLPSSEQSTIGAAAKTSKPAAVAANGANGAARATGTSGRNSQPKDAAPAPPAKEPVTLTVSRSASSLTVTSKDGRTLFFGPVTTGSEHDPLPIGDWKINGAEYNPSFRYNPELFWDANPTHTKAKIPPGPNGPVGVVWIDITKEHYGIHGSPEPSQIGKTASHGCVRLTNWDAMRVANLVSPGTLVRFVE